MVKLGMMIGDRYEIIEKIGTGGMSDVYKAKCHKLNRYVAVKVLKQEFAENENFVSKFIIEAQAAAGLMHPNIVNVYDVGEEEGIHYIVMELIEGITLKKYIEKKARLSYKEAVSIAIQVSLGIEAAHNNHIIHRDIKPQNIIISKDGKVKVTDFGIAKAASSNTITSNVMGSVHYTSPEQARGGYSDEKSDVYSLGITMFEMLTGRVPFNGETTVAIAIKHIQEELPSPREFVPEIPYAVEAIVLKCCQKSPDRRYQNMADLVADLKQSLVTPNDDFVVISGPDLEGGTRTMTEQELSQVRQRTIADTSDSDNRYQNSEEPADYGEDPYEDDQRDYPYKERTPLNIEKLTTIGMLVVGVAILVVIVVLVIQLGNRLKQARPALENPIKPSTEEESESIEQKEIVYKEVPSVEGMTADEARAAIRAAGFLPLMEYKESEDVPAGNVIRSGAAAGTQLEEGSEITLIVSSGVEGIMVPEVSGYSYEEAENLLTQKGFRVNRMDDYSDVEEGMVFYQNPVSGVKAPKGSVITLTVSKGREAVKCRVPNLVGLEQTEGTFEAIESGLAIGNITMVYNESFDAGQICSQSYSHGTYVDPGTEIDITVSLGKEKATYKCNASIMAPSANEAPDYSAGTEVSLKLITDTGEVLLDTRTTSFPLAVNFYNLDAPGGNLTVTYTVKIPGAVTTDPTTGETVIGAGSTETKSFSRRIDFVRE